MKKKLFLIACIGVLAAIFLLPLVQSSMGKTDFIREVLAKNDGFAAEGSGTTIVISRMGSSRRKRIFIVNTSIGTAWSILRIRRTTSRCRIMFLNVIIKRF